jgi:hypothetical protein
MNADLRSHRMFLVADEEVLSDADAFLVRCVEADYEAADYVPRNTRMGGQRYFGWMRTRSSECLLHAIGTQHVRRFPRQSVKGGSASPGRPCRFEPVRPRRIRIANLCFTAIDTPRSWNETVDSDLIYSSNISHVHPRAPEHGFNTEGLPNNIQPHLRRTLGIHIPQSRLQRQKQQIATFFRDREPGAMDPNCLANRSRAFRHRPHQIPGQHHGSPSRDPCHSSMDGMV